MSANTVFLLNSASQPLSPTSLLSAWIVPRFEKTARWNVRPPPTPHTWTQLNGGSQGERDEWREKENVWAGKDVSECLKNMVGWKMCQKSRTERWPSGYYRREEYTHSRVCQRQLRNLNMSWKCTNSKHFKTFCEADSPSAACKLWDVE